MGAAEAVAGAVYPCFGGVSGRGGEGVAGFGNEEGAARAVVSIPYGFDLSDAVGHDAPEFVRVTAPMLSNPTE